MSFIAELPSWVPAPPTHQQLEALKAILAVAALVTSFGIFIYWLRRTTQKIVRLSEERSRAIQSALGTTFQPTQETPKLYLRLLTLTSPTLRWHGIHMLANRFEGSAKDGRTLRWVEAGYHAGKASTRWQTIVHVSGDGWHFPAFSIKPRGLWSRLGLRRNLGFERHLELSRLFDVKCEDETAARSFLTVPLLEALPRFSGLTVEGRGCNVLFFRKRKVLEPNEFPLFQRDVLGLVALFPRKFGEPKPPP